MESWSIIDIKNMSTTEMRQLMAQLQKEISFREGIGEAISAQNDPQFLSEAGLHTAEDDDPVAGI